MSSKDYNEKELKDGLSGIMRVKNEARFIEKCINSCIDSLDELIVVYNDCTDETPQILEKIEKRYPDKLKVYKYEHNVLSLRLTEAEFEYAMSLPEDSPRLFCNQCNYLLSKVGYKYAMIIDADQIYYAKELERWRQVCSCSANYKKGIRYLLGKFCVLYISLYRWISMRIGRPSLALIPNRLVKMFFNSYRYYSEFKLKEGKFAISFSGLNLFKDKEWYVPFDHYNINPPYNGEGDHLIFKVSKDTYFSRTYNKRLFLSVNEHFNHPYKLSFMGLMWFHLHANKEFIEDKVKAIKEKNPDLFVPIADFLNMSYNKVNAKMDKKIHTVYQRTIFAIVHKIGVVSIKDNIKILDTI